MCLDVVNALRIVDVLVIGQDIVKSSTIFRDVDGYLCVFSSQPQDKIIQGFWTNLPTHGGSILGISRDFLVVQDTILDMLDQRTRIVVDSQKVIPGRYRLQVSVPDEVTPACKPAKRLLHILGVGGSENWIQEPPVGQSVSSQSCFDVFRSIRHRRGG